MPRWAAIPVVLVPPVVVLLVYAIATSGATASLGRVPIPGERRLTLDGGKVTLHYEERRNLEEGSGTPVVDDADFLEIPGDLRVLVTGEDGRRVPVERVRFGNVEEQTGRVAKAFARVDLPRDGTYTFSARPIGRDAPRPAVTLGPNGWEEFRPWGLGAGGALALGLVGAVFVLALNRR